MLSRLCGILVFVTASTAHAGAWLQPQGKGLAIGQATYYTTDRYFDVDGRRQKQSRFTKREFQPYVEYGLHDNVTIGASAYVDHVRQAGKNNFGIADPEIFARTRLWHNDTQTVSIQPLVKFSSYFANGDSPRAGSRSTDVELSVLYGRNQPIFTTQDYTDVRVGYRKRNRGSSDQLRFDSAVGIKVNNKIEIVPAVRGVMAINPTDSAVYTENGELDYSVLKAEIGGIYHLDDQRWLQASVFKHVKGVQTGEGYGASIGYAQGF